MHLVFRDFSIYMYNPLSKDFPETDCHTFLNSIIIFLFRNVYTALYLFVALFHALFHGMKEERECRIPSPFSMFIIFSTLSHSFASFLCFRKWTPAMQDSHSIQVFTSDWQWNKCQKRDRLLCEVLIDCSVRYCIDFEQHYKSGDDKKVPWNMIRC